MGGPVPQAVSEAMRMLWGRHGPRPQNALSTLEFKALQNACVATYPINSGLFLSMSLWEILRSLGCPMLLPEGQGDKALDVEVASRHLHTTLTTKSAEIVHLCPLDWADEPPPLAFGRSAVGRFSAEQLMDMLDAPRLARLFPETSIDWAGLSEFYWLVVMETIDVASDPVARTSPFLSNMDRDLGAITAHEERYPPAVVMSLFLILLAPWEDWAEAMEVDWRGFRLPWVYSLSDDLCERPPLPPTPERLTLVPRIFDDADGGTIEIEEPARFNLSVGAASLAKLVNEESWSQLEIACRSPLFETPVRHFFIRAFHASGIDEFMAHLTVLEAALGLQSDFGKGKRTPQDPRGNRGASALMKERVARLLDDPGAGDEFEALFNLRSTYVHGRPMAQISSADRFRARRLARRTVAALVEKALGESGPPPDNREAFLIDLSRKTATDQSFPKQ